MIKLQPLTVMLDPDDGCISVYTVDGSYVSISKQADEAKPQRKLRWEMLGQALESMVQDAALQELEAAIRAMKL